MESYVKMWLIGNNPLKILFHPVANSFAVSVIKMREQNSIKFLLKLELHNLRPILGAIKSLLLLKMMFPISQNKTYPTFKWKKIVNTLN